MRPGVLGLMASGLPGGRLILVGRGLRSALLAAENKVLQFDYQLDIKILSNYLTKPKFCVLIFISSIWSKKFQPNPFLFTILNIKLVEP